MAYDWNFSFLASPDNLRLLLEGALSTIWLSLWAVLIGTLIGLVLGAFSVTGSSSFLPLRQSLSTKPKKTIISCLLALLRYLTLVIIDVLRAIPLLILILFCYYAFPYLFPFVPRDNVFWPVLFALSINLAAFVAELVRASIIALPQSQLLVARSHGFSVNQTWRHIVLPQIYREIMPAMIMLYFTIIKMSTLASVVSMYEIMHSANSIVQRTYRPLEAYALVALFFILLLVPLGVFARRLEQTTLFRRRSL